MPQEAAEAPFTAETLTIEGSEPLKSLEVKDGKARVGAYAIRFSDVSEPDLTGEYFTKSTDFGPRSGDGAAAMFNHGQAYTKAFDEVCRRTFGAVKTTRDDVGIFAEATLDLSDKYQKAIANLCAQGRLKWSSGTSAHLLQKTAAGEITRWHPIEFSYTPTPAEPRLPAIRPLKSLSTLSAPLTAQLGAAFDPEPPTVADAAATVAPAKDADETDEAAASLPALAQQAPAPIVFVDTGRAPMPETPAPTSADKKTLRDAEVKEMIATGEHFAKRFPEGKCVDIASDFVHLGKSLDDLRAHIAENVCKAQPVVTDPKVGMAKGDRKNWSLLKAIREVASNGFNHAAITGREKDASEATATAIKRSPQGFFIPHDVVTANLAQDHDLGSAAIKALIEQAGAMKTLNATNFTGGGALVGTELLTGSMIELLRNKPLVAQMGARTLTGLMGNVAIPRLNGGASTYWVNEQGALTDSDQSFGQLGLTPKKLGARTGYTKELLSQTALSVEALVRDDLMTQLSIEKDRAAINGSGGAQPLGILNQPVGLNTVTFGATATRAKAIAFQKELAIDNATRGALAYMTTPTVSAAWMGIPEVPNFPQWLWAGNVDTGTVVGRPAQSTNQVPSDRVIYGNWNDLILADWAGLDVVVNPYSNDAQGIVKITIFLLTDCGVRQLVSFCVSTDSGAQ